MEQPKQNSRARRAQRRRMNKALEKREEKIERVVEKKVDNQVKKQKKKKSGKQRRLRNVYVEQDRPLDVKGKGDWSRGTCDEKTNGNILSEYTQTILNPKDYMCRYPDGDLRKTALLRTCEVYEIPAFFFVGNKTGRFSACIRPYMGNSAIPNQFHCGIANQILTGSDWNDVDWSLASSYQSDNGGFDPRIDKNKPFLTAMQSGFYYQESDSILAPPQTNPVTGTFLFGNGINSQDFGLENNGINIRIAPTRNDTLIFPQGTFLVTVAQSYTSAVAGPITVGITANGSTVATFIDDMIGFANTNTATITGIGSVGDAYYQFAVNSTGVNNTLRINTFQNTSATVLPAGVLSQITTLVSIVPTQLPTQFNVSANQGAIEEIRPVAQSCLATYMGTNYENGGMIAIHYAPPDLIDSNYYGNAGDQRGQLQIYENLASIPGAYDDRLAKGAYAWWSPYTKTDEAFRNVGAANAYRLPGIIISGTEIINEAPTVNATQKVVRLEVYTVYEYTTASSALELKELRGSDQIIDMCNNALSAQKHVMENNKHIDFLRRMAKNLLVFAMENKDVIVKIGALAVSVL